MPESNLTGSQKHELLTTSELDFPLPPPNPPQQTRFAFLPSRNRAKNKTKNKQE